MKKKEYLKPTMRMVRLNHSTRLLVGSYETNNVSAQRRGYGTANDGYTDTTWE